MGQRFVEHAEIHRATRCENFENAAHRLRHGDVYPLRHLPQHRTHRIGHMRMRWHDQLHAQAQRHGRVIAASRRAHTHEWQVRRKLQRKNRVLHISVYRLGGGCGPGCITPQGHRGQQGRHLARVGLVHVSGVVQTRLDQLLANRVGDLGHHIARGCHRIAQRPLAQAVHMPHLARPNARGANRSLGIPVVGHTQHMRRIAGGEAGVNRQALALQAGHGAGQIAVVDVGGLQVDRALAQAFPGAHLGIIEPPQMRRIGRQGLGKTHLAGVRYLALLALQHRQKLRMLVHQQTQGQHPARAYGQALAALQAHLAVAAQANRVHLDRLDHGPPIADHRAVKTQGWQAAAHHRNIGGGAAHVGDDGVLQTAERTRAQHAGGRAGQDRADRALQGAGHVDQRTIAFDNHQRRVNMPLGQGALHRIDQGFDVRNHARVQRGGQRAARRAQAGCQLVAAGHGHITQFLHPGADLHFMGRVAHRKGG